MNLFRDWRGSLHFGNVPDNFTMKVTQNWRKQFVHFNESPQELAERLILPSLALRATLR